MIYYKNFNHLEKELASLAFNLQRTDDGRYSITYEDGSVWIFNDLSLCESFLQGVEFSRNLYT